MPAGTCSCQPANFIGPQVKYTQDCWVHFTFWVNLAREPHYPCLPTIDMIGINELGKQVDRERRLSTCLPRVMAYSPYLIYLFICLNGLAASRSPELLPALSAKLR